MQGVFPSKTYSNGREVFLKKNGNDGFEKLTCELEGMSKNCRHLATVHKKHTLYGFFIDAPFSSEAEQADPKGGAEAASVPSESTRNQKIYFMLLCFVCFCLWLWFILAHSGI